MRYIQYPESIDLLAFHQHHPTLFPALLQSVGEKGWDILFALPQETKRFYSTDTLAFFEALNNIKVGSTEKLDSAQHFPFYGGWFFYAGYELLHTIEPSVLVRETPNHIPLAALIRIPAAILYDRQSQTTWLVAEDDLSLEELQQTLYPLFVQTKPLEVLALEEESPDAFLKGVEACKKYIVEGDVFQVNLSRAWDATLSENNTAMDIYYQLRKMNPAPFSGCVDLGEMAIISSSPERLVKSQEGKIEMRPIAGTAARVPAQDEEVKAQLIENEKERAEHIMLVDLVRNDLGRICQPGTVEVEELMQVTTYTHVHHIESTITGKSNEGITVADIIRAVFPGGTITGCPKVRTMQIIRELELRPRFAYTGSLGYINQDGSLDMNILIRSFIKLGTHLYFRTGAGIVADSIAENELQETRAKAKGLLRALGVD